MAELVAEGVVERFGDLWPRCLGEVGPSSLLAFAIRDQRELADDERLAADIGDAPVELALIVLEDPKPGDTPAEPVSVVRTVVDGHAEEDAKALSDSSDLLAVDGHRGRSDPLDDRAHGHVLSSERPFWTIRRCVEAAHDLTQDFPRARARLGGLLRRAGLVTVEQLEEALGECERTGRRVGEIVVERGWVSGAEVARTVAEQHELPFVDIAEAPIADEATTLLPEELARRYVALPLSLREGRVVVAVADPADVVTSDDIRLALGMPASFVVAERDGLERAIARAYRPPLEVDAPEADETAERPRLDDVRDVIQASAPAVKLVNTLISRAVEDGASDIHFEPREKHVAVRARIDGLTRELAVIPKSLQPAVTARLKVMAELDIAERRVPQDGRVSVRFGGQTLDLRIAVLPTTYGEQIVLRIIHRAARLGLAELGMSPGAEEAFARAIRQPYGAVVVCGPTGSGKTTTLYAALDRLNAEERVLMTIEDPVEYQIPGVNQVELSPRAGLTFARGLRTILRSDPDVLLVGEIRDEETAGIAMQAAMTGHLVLTSLHAHNAASSLARLKDMGVEPSILATSINCIVAQRLARRLCLECREPYRPSRAELEELGVDGKGPRTGLHRARGCDACSHTGYRGRVALYEVLPVQGPIRRLIEASTEEIFAAAVADGMRTLRQDGLRLCLEGVSSLDEVRRVTGDRLS